jgi:hypothetical protein
VRRMGVSLRPGAGGAPRLARPPGPGSRSATDRERLGRPSAARNRRSPPGILSGDRQALSRGGGEDGSEGQTGQGRRG